MDPSDSDRVTPVSNVSTHKIGEEVLDVHIYDDHGNPHQAALDGADADDHVTAWTWLAVFFLGFTLVSSLNFAFNVVNSVATVIAMKLQGNLNNVNWIPGGYSISGSIAFAIAGQMSDYFGRKDVLTVGQLLLVLGHVVGACAYSVNQVIAAMVILGAGTGTTFVVYAGISELLPNKWRAIGLASTEAILIVGSSLGPICGRALSAYASWRYIYVLGAITGVIALAGTTFFYHPPRRVFRDRTKRQVLHELDHVGIFLYTSGATLCLLGLGWGGTRYPWRSSAVIAPLVIGAVLFLGTFAWDFTGRAARPLFPYRLFKMFRGFTAILMVSFSAGLAHIALGAFIPQQISYLFTSNPIRAGWYQVPSGFTAVLGGAVFGSLIHRMKHVPLQFLVANVIQTVAIGLLAIITPNRVAAGLALQAIANTPFGFLTVLSYVSIGLHVPQRDLGLAYGLNGASRYLGGAVGSTIFNTILRNRAAMSVPAKVAQAVVPLGFPASGLKKLLPALQSGSPAKLAAFPADVVAAGLRAVRWGYTDAFQYVWYASIPFGAIACAISLCILDPSPYFTNHRAVTSTKERPGRVQHPRAADASEDDKASVQEVA